MILTKAVYEATSIAPLLPVNLAMYDERVKPLRGYSKLQIDAVAALICSGAGTDPGDGPMGIDRTQLEVRVSRLEVLRYVRCSFVCVVGS